MGFLKSKNKPTNLQYKWVTDTYKPAAESSMRAGQAGLNTFMGALTGEDDGAGLEQYKRSTGYGNIFNEAMRGVTSNRAAKGMLASGSLIRRSQDQAGQLAQQNFANWLGQILQGSQLNLNQGNNYANLVANVAAQRSQRGGFANALSNLQGVANLASSVGGLLSGGGKG
jgi:hypothetical protein